MLPDEGHVVRVTIAVSGDLGRSPRIQYHALALAERGVDVELIGTRGSPCLEEVEAAPRIRVQRLAAPPFEQRDPARRVGFLLRSAWRQVQQTFALGTALLRAAPGSDRLLVQNPPAAPTLPLAWVVARLFRTRLVVDWHNLSSAVLRDKIGGGPATALLAAIERACGRRADEHLCVSRALAALLSQELAVEARVFPDRPHARFLTTPRPGSDADRRRVRDELGLGGEARLLVCPTSWSVDEDFGLLLEALESWDARARGAPLAVVVTGRGPGRADFERLLAARRFRRARVETRWLGHRDYARLLACADLGICLHRSTSGLDLPMKLSDMLGVGLPVCVLDYGPVLAEALPDPGAALRFVDAAGLVASWQTLFADEGDTRPAFEALRAAAASPLESWDVCWQRVAAPSLGLA